MLFASHLPELSQVAALFPLLSCFCSFPAQLTGVQGQQEGAPPLWIIIHQEQRKASSFRTLDLGHRELSKCSKHTPWLGV